jgi:hypothetical protein
MPELEIVSLQEAQGQRKYLPEYIEYIHTIPQGEAGKLKLAETENPGAIRRRLVLAAQALGITLGIKRSGQHVYFWIKPAADEKPKRGRGRLRRTQEDTVPLEQPVSEPEAPDESAVAGEIA